MFGFSCGTDTLVFVSTVWVQVLPFINQLFHNSFTACIFTWHSRERHGGYNINDSACSWYGLWNEAYILCFSFLQKVWRPQSIFNQCLLNYIKCFPLWSNDSSKVSRTCQMDVTLNQILKNICSNFQILVLKLLHVIFIPLQYMPLKCSQV